MRAGRDYTAPKNTSWMSQADDVANGRHFLHYLARNLPGASKCEPHHSTFGPNAYQSHPYSWLAQA